MIIVGIDDTDTLDSPGTNQLAKAIVRAASSDWQCVRIVRHQLFYDDRIPYTSKNGSASITLQPRTTSDVPELTRLCERIMGEWYVEGSDPGLCVADYVPDAVTAFGKMCKTEVMTQTMARQLAAQQGIFLKGLGGTEGGIIGSLAAIGLAVTGEDGRVVQHGEWPDDLSGRVSIATLSEREIDVINVHDASVVHSGNVDVGKHLRPNRRGGRTVVFVEANSSMSPDVYVALKLT